ncbi:MAG: hypothetical protein GY918_10680, partial [Gammaproteobacteria bacterium]|nr:hypothetical protein [Gammaproteobacteria bacterium]
NEAAETYATRVGDVVKFVHGDKEIAVPYASLLELGEIYTADVSITATEIIGVVNGIELARESIIGEPVAVWGAEGNIGGFNQVDSPIIVSNFKVKSYSEKPRAADFSDNGDFANNGDFA